MQRNTIAEAEEEQNEHVITIDEIEGDDAEPFLSAKHTPPLVKLRHPLADKLKACDNLLAILKKEYLLDHTLKAISCSLLLLLTGLSALLIVCFNLMKNSNIIDREIELNHLGSLWSSQAVKEYNSTCNKFMGPPKNYCSPHYVMYNDDQINWLMVHHPYDAPLLPCYRFIHNFCSIDYDWNSAIQQDSTVIVLASLSLIALFGLETYAIAKIWLDSKKKLNQILSDDEFGVVQTICATLEIDVPPTMLPKELITLLQKKHDELHYEVTKPLKRLAFFQGSLAKSKGVALYDNFFSKLSSESIIPQVIFEHADLIPKRRPF